MSYDHQPYPIPCNFGDTVVWFVTLTLCGCRCCSCWGPVSVARELWKVALDSLPEFSSWVLKWVTRNKRERRKQWTSYHSTGLCPPSLCVLPPFPLLLLTPFHSFPTHSLTFLSHPLALSLFPFLSSSSLPLSSPPPIFPLSLCLAVQDTAVGTPLVSPSNDMIVVFVNLHYHRRKLQNGVVSHQRQLREGK